MNEAADFPKEVCAIYQSRRDALIDGLDRIGWDIPKPGGSMFVWAPIPEPYAEMDSVEFCSLVVRDADVALSPGVGFGPGGEGFVRFALIENEQRIAQGVRNLRRGPAEAGLEPVATGRRPRFAPPLTMPARWCSRSCGCPIGRARSARWPAASVRSTATSWRSTSSSAAAARSSTSW